MIISCLCFVYIMQNVIPDPGSSPGSLDCKSEALTTELRGPLGIIQVKYVYKIYHVSNCVIMMITGLSVTYLNFYLPIKASIIT